MALLRSRSHLGLLLLLGSDGLAVMHVVIVTVVVAHVTAAHIAPHPAAPPAAGARQPAAQVATPPGSTTT